MGWAAAALGLILVVSSHQLLAQRVQQPSPLKRLEASILRTTRSINATWGIT